MPAIEPVAPEDIGRRAWDIYYQVRAVVETEENIGKFITIDVLSGDYEVGANHIAGVEVVRARHEVVQTCTLRIGYSATYARGGRLVRTA